VFLEQIIIRIISEESWDTED